MTRNGPCPRCGAVYSTTCGQGSGIFIYGNYFANKPKDFPYIYDGIFDAFDIIKESLETRGNERSEYWNYNKVTKPFLVGVNVCMTCGFIYGECTDLQKEVWGVTNNNNCKISGSDKKEVLNNGL